MKKYAIGLMILASFSFSSVYKNITYPYNAVEVGGVTLSASTATTVDAKDQYRRYMVICNDSDTVVYLAIGTTPNLNQGIRLNANGGTYEIDDDNFTDLTVKAITAGASKRITYQVGRKTR